MQKRRDINIIPPGTGLYRIITAPKLPGDDLRVFMERQIEAFLPGKRSDFDIDFIHSPMPGNKNSVNCLLFIIRKDIRREIGSALPAIPALIQLLRSAGAGDGIYCVAGRHSLELLLIFSGCIQYCTSFALPEADYSKTHQQFPAGAINEIKKQLQSTQNLKPDVFSAKQQSQFSPSKPIGINSLIQELGMPQEVNREIDLFAGKRKLTGKGLHTEINKKQWFSDNDAKKRNRTPILVFLLSCVILASSIVLPPVIELENLKTKIETKVEQVEQLQISLGKTPTPTDGIQKQISDLPVKFSPLLTLILNQLEQGDYISRIEFRDGAFVIDFIARNPFIKRDNLSSQAGIYDLTVSRITSIQNDNRERFSLQGRYSYVVEKKEVGNDPE